MTDSKKGVGNRAGRPKGVRNKRTDSLAAIMEKLKHNPAEYQKTEILDRVMNIGRGYESAGHFEQALDAYRLAADINGKLIPYLHPKLSSTELKAGGEDGITGITVTWNPPKDDLNDSESS